MNDQPLRLMLRMLEAHSPLDDEDGRALLALPVTMRTLEAASYIVREGEPPRNCGVLVSGYAFRQKLTGDGARQIVSLHIPGDALDMQNLFLDVADHNVQTLTRAELAMIPRQALRDLAQARPAIGHAMMVGVLVESSIFREWVLNVGRRSAQARVAHLLCEFAERLIGRGLAESDGYELPMTQEQLGDALGLTSVHVNRTLKALESAGLITRNRRHIAFPRADALRHAADFNARYLHLEQQVS